MRHLMIKLLFFAWAALLIGLDSSAQKFNNCGFDTYYKLRNLEKKSLVSSNRSLNCTGPFNIPVIVHVVHSENITNSDANWSDNNLSEWQVYNYLNLANALLASANPQMDITLKPACRNTAGVTMKPVVWHADDDFTTIDMNPVSGNDETMKNTYNNQSGSTTPTTQYLHIWVVDEIINTSQYNNGTGIAGFATFPSSNGLAADGIVIENDFFTNPATNNNKALVLAHELGHYLNLFHTFEGACNSADECMDTPPDNDQVGTSDCTPVNSCHQPSEDPDNNDLPDNIMDYSNTITCLTHFTDCQYTRMHNVLCDVRTGLNNSPGLNCNCPNPVNFSFTSYPNTPCNNPITMMDIPALPPGYTITWQVDGITVPAPGNTFSISTPGAHIITGILENGNPDCRKVYSIVIDVYATSNLDINTVFSPNPLQAGSPAQFSIVNPAAGVQYTWDIEGLVYTGATVSHTVTSAGCISYTVTAKSGNCTNTKTFSMACNCPSNIGFENGNPVGYQFTGNTNNIVIHTTPVSDPILGTINPRFGNGFLQMGNDVPSIGNPESNTVTFTYTPTASSDKLILSVYGYTDDGHSYTPGAPEYPAMFGFKVEPQGTPGFTGPGYLSCHYADFAGIATFPNNQQSYTQHNSMQGNGIIRLENWTDYVINLACFEGIPVKITLYVQDCYEGQHNAKAFFDLTCGDAAPNTPKTFLPNQVTICKGDNTPIYEINNGCNYVEVSFNPSTNVHLTSNVPGNLQFYFRPDVTTTYTVTYKNGNCGPVSETITVIVRDKSEFVNAGGDVTVQLCYDVSSFTPGLINLPPAIVPQGLLFHYEWFNSGDDDPQPSEFIGSTITPSFSYNQPVSLTAYNPYYFIRKLVIDSPYDSCYNNICKYGIERVRTTLTPGPGVDVCENTATLYSVQYKYFFNSKYRYTSFELIDAANPAPPIAIINNPPQTPGPVHTVTFNFTAQLNIEYRVLSRYKILSTGEHCFVISQKLPINVFPRLGSAGEIQSQQFCYSNPFTPVTFNGTPALTLAGITYSGFRYQWQYSTDNGNTYTDIGAQQSQPGPFVFDPVGFMPGGIVIIRRMAINSFCNETMYSNIIILRPVYNLSNMIQCPPMACNVTGGTFTITGNDLVAGLAAYGCTGGYYEWYTSSDGINYTPVPNSNVKDLTLTVSGILYVKRRFVCSNCYDKTAECKIELVNVQPGSIPSSVNIAPGSTTLNISSVIPATITPASNLNCIKWYYAIAATGPFTVITNNTAADPNNLQWAFPPGLPATIYLKREIENLCGYAGSCTAVSNTCTVNFPVFDPGTVYSGISGFCTTTGSININNYTAATAPAGCVVSYLWEYKIGNGTWNTAPGANTGVSYVMNIALFSANMNNNDFICFRRKATAQCQKTIYEGYSNEFCLQYCKKQGTLLIAANQFSCTIPYTPTAFTVISNTSPTCFISYCGPENAYYTWQESADGINFTTIPNTWTTTYTAPVFTQYATRFYRVIKTCTRFYCSDTSNIVTIIVSNKHLNTPGQIGYSQTLMVNQTPNMIISTSPHFCNCTTPVFHWLRKIGNGSWVSLAGVTSEYYSPPTSTFATTVQYQRQMICGQTVNLLTNIVKLDFINGGIIGKTNNDIVQQLKEEQPAGITVVPVPAADMIRLFIQTEQAYPVSVSFTDLSGKEVLPAMNLVPGSKEGIPVNTSRLSAGIYLAKVFIPGRNIVKMAKFVISR